MRCPYDVAHIAGVHAVRADRQRHVICDLVGLACRGQRGAYPLSWVVQRPLSEISDTSLDERLWPFVTNRRASPYDSEETSQHARKPSYNDRPDYTSMNDANAAALGPPAPSAVKSSVSVGIGFMEDWYGPRHCDPHIAHSKR